MKLTPLRTAKLETPRTLALSGKFYMYTVYVTVPSVSYKASTSAMDAGYMVPYYETRQALEIF